jgi:hypothetical protein
MSAWPPRDDADAGPLRRASLREMQQAGRTAPARAARGTSGSLVLNAGGYAYGLSVTQTCDFRHVVAHGGGLPGFGSYMRWLPEYGVGIIALGNRTYTSWAGVTGEAFEALARTGALQPRRPQPSPALVRAREAVSRLITRWDDRLADEIAANNLYLDQSKERRRAELDRLRSEHGACRADGPFDVENALRGQWRMSCGRGALQVSITLAPTMPPRVQYLLVRTAGPAAAQNTGACAQ